MYYIYNMYIYLFIKCSINEHGVYIYIYIRVYVMHFIDVYNTDYMYILYNIYLCIHLYTKKTTMYTYTNKDVL